MRRATTLALVGLALLSGPARASIVTFGGLTGGNGDVYTSYTEDGFTVASTTGDWQKGFAYGNPLPSIFSQSVLASVTVTNGSLFTFNSADLGNADDTGTPEYVFEGFLGAAQQFTSSGSLPSTAVFATYASPDTTTAIDRLVITIRRGTTSSYNIDNINVTANAIPEPFPLLLGSIGALCAGAYRLRRRAKVAA